MKIAFTIFLLLLFRCSNGSSLIRQSCKEASNGDPNLNYDFCVSCLQAISEGQPRSLEDLVGCSIQIAKSNATNIVSKISELLKDQTFGQYEKNCLKDCFDLYSDALSELDEAVGAFKSKDLDTANIKVSSAMDASVTCEDQFKDKEGAKSPLTEDSNMYFQINVMSLAFIEMYRHRS